MDGGLYIGIDLGTTSVKVGVFDDSGAAVAFASREFELDTPEPGFAEFHADGYIGCAFDGVREVLADGGADGASVRAIGLSSQAQTFVLVGEGGSPVRPAVGWLDVRAGEEAGELSEISRGLGGGEVNAIASAPKLLWLRRREPEALERAERVLLIPDYLIWRLTGRAATDPITAGSTHLMDRETLKWRGPLLDACGLAPGMMPDVLAPGEAAGPLTAAAAGELGLGAGVVVAVGTNDQSAGMLGAGNVTPGCASVTLGTALAIMLTTDSREGAAPGVGVAPHPAGGGLWSRLAYAKTAGIVLRWFRDNFAPGSSYEELFEEIGSVPAGSDGVSCLPHFSGTATPEFNPSVRGAFSGLTLSHGRAHLARALVESLAFTVRENVELLAAGGGGAGGGEAVAELRAVGGGARSDVWLQMISDCTGVPVERPRAREAACLGAAELAMVAAGRFGSVAEAATGLYAPDKRFGPDPSGRAAYDEAFGRYRGLYAKLYGGKE